MGQLKLTTRFARLVACGGLCAVSLVARAQPGVPGLTNSINKGIEIGVPVASAVAVAVIYGVVYSRHRLEGCAVAVGGAIELRGKGGQQNWILSGDTASIRPGERVLLSGKREKGSRSGSREFAVSRLREDKGPCP